MLAALACGGATGPSAVPSLSGAYLIRLSVTKPCPPSNWPGPQLSDVSYHAVLEQQGTTLTLALSPTSADNYRLESDIQATVSGRVVTFRTFSVTESGDRWRRVVAATTDPAGQATVGSSIDGSLNLHVSSCYDLSWEQYSFWECAPFCTGRIPISLERE
jgi:hypothetical protein